MGCCESKVDRKLLKVLQPQFDALQLRPHEVRKMWLLFNKVDVDGSGSISLRELLNFLNMGETKFRDRVFSIFDEDGSGQIDFREFVLSLWNYCTLSKATLDLFAFDLYDTDNNGLLAADEVHGMLHDLYGHDSETHPTAKAVAAELRQMYKAQDIDIEAFQRFVRNHPSLLFPAFLLQQGLRRCILGAGFWERASERRIQLCEGRFIPVSEFVKLNLNSLLRNAELRTAGIVGEEARYVLANTGTINARYQHAMSTVDESSTAAPSPLRPLEMNGITNANSLSQDEVSARNGDRHSQRSSRRQHEHHRDSAKSTNSGSGSPMKDSVKTLRHSTKEERSAALDTVFSTLMKEEEVHLARMRAGYGGHGSHGSTPQSSDKQTGLNSSSNDHTQGHRHSAKDSSPTPHAHAARGHNVVPNNNGLPSLDSFLLDQPAARRASIKPGGAEDRSGTHQKYPRRHTMQDRPAASATTTVSDVRNQIQEDIVRRVGGTAVEVPRMASFLGRRPTLP